jgi:hypothetical protein
MEGILLKVSRRIVKNESIMLALNLNRLWMGISGLQMDGG